MNLADNWKVNVFRDGDRAATFSAKEIKHIGEDFVVEFQTTEILEDLKGKKGATVAFKSIPINSLELDRLFGSHKSTKGIESILEIQNDGRATFQINEVDLGSILSKFQLL